jgi:hypothetical protein
MTSAISINVLTPIRISTIYLINVKLIRYQFWCIRCAFRVIKSLQWYSGRKSWKSENNCEHCKRTDPLPPQILCHEIEPNPSKDRAMNEGDNPSFWDEFIKFSFFLTVLFIFVFSSILSYWAVWTRINKGVNEMLHNIHKTIKKTMLYFS